LHLKIRSSIFGRDEQKEGAISGLVLVQTVQKIVEDNERLGQECNLKTQRIDELREKVTELLEKNKRYV
jgi:polyhydroxyalkanoate synthesis regulator phasin